MNKGNRFAAIVRRSVMVSGLFVASGVSAQTGTELYESIELDKDQLEEPAEDAVALGKISVTGSRIKRTDYETVNPILTVDRDMIERSGVTSLGDLLQDLPVAGSALGTAFNNGGTGAVEVDLRNLGSQRVLVLVNGRRWVNGIRSLSTSSVDLTTIPVSIVERIDVLKDGASATYGSDAIAGVINIITRDDFDGLELRGHYGAFDEGDGIRENLTASWGGVLGKTSIFVDLNYANDKEVLAGSRNISKVPLFGTGNTRGSLGTPQGTFVFVPNPVATDPGLLANECDRLEAAGGVIEGETGIAFPLPIPEQANQVPLCWLTLRDGASGTSQSDFRRQLPEDAHNYAPINYLVTPNERTSAYAQITQPLPWNMNFKAEMLANRRVSQQVLAEMPLFTGDLLFPPYSTIYIAEDQQFNPFGQDIGRADSTTELIGTGAVLRRLVEQGARDFRQTVDTQRLGFGLNGDFDFMAHNLAWEIGATWGRSKNEEVSFGLLDLDHARLALGPNAACTADPDCVPLNMFGGQGADGKGTITQEMLDYLVYVDRGSQEQKLQDYYFTVSTDLYDLPAGPLGFAFGFELREEEYLSVPSPFVQAGRSSTNQQSITQGTIKATEFFVEFAVPLLTAQPFAESLELSLAARQSNYDAFGSKAVGKVGLRWQPVGDLMVRTTASEAFRAPAITDLYLGRAQSYPLIDDPCDAEARADNENADQNCADDGVPADYSQTLLQIPSDFGGNTELEPETARTYTAGLVYSPSYVQGLNMAVDWYSVEIENYIDVPGAQYVMDSCYRAAPDERALCDAVDRNPDTGAVNSILNQFQNFSQLKTSGVDLTMDYTLPWDEFGQFKLLMDTSYLIEFTAFLPTTSGGFKPEERAGTYDGGNAVNYPRVKSNLQLVWNLQNMEASWTSRYIHAVMESCDDGFEPSLVSLGLCSHPDADGGPMNELGAVWYHDLQFTYTVMPFDLDLVLGVDNVFDKAPPVGFTSFANSYDVSSYDVPGVFSYLRFVKRF